MPAAAPIVINMTIFNNPLQWLLDNLNDFSLDNVAACYPTKIKINKVDQTIDVWTEDKEEKIEIKHHDSIRCIEALKLLCMAVYNGNLDKASGRNDHKDDRLYLDGIDTPMALQDPCNWDIAVWDSYFQLLHNGEILYG